MTYWVVTMSMHKLTAGSGYDYLTRQVAALDATDKGMSGWPTATRPRANPPAGGWVPGWTGSTVWRPAIR